MKVKKEFIAIILKNLENVYKNSNVEMDIHDIYDMIKKGDINLKGDVKSDLITRYEGYKSASFADPINYARKLKVSEDGEKLILNYTSYFKNPINYKRNTAIEISPKNGIVTLWCNERTLQSSYSFNKRGEVKKEESSSVSNAKRQVAEFFGRDM